MKKELLNENDRINFPASIFGIQFPLQIEPVIYSVADSLSCDYNGGYWNMYRLGDNGFYMAADEDIPFRVECMNGYEGELSADAFGITVCLYAYSQLSFTSKTPEIYIKQYYQLKEYMLEHQEVQKILAAID